MKHKLACVTTQKQAEALAADFFTATATACAVEETSDGIVIVFDDEDGFHGGLDRKRAFVAGWLACAKRQEVANA